MTQAYPPSRSRRKRCLHCRDLFDPDPRARDRQKYCSKVSCQNHRQRLNEKIWRVNNPDCLPYQQEQSRTWHRAHSDYSRKRRLIDDVLNSRNRLQTRLFMRDFRFKKMFDKSKEMFMQLIGKQKDTCCLILGRWLLLRLTKASPLSKPWNVRHTGQKLKQVTNQLPKGRPYDLSSLFNDAGRVF